MIDHLLDVDDGLERTGKRQASLHHNLQRSDVVQIGLPTLMLRSTSTTELDSNEPDSKMTMDSNAVSEPSAMAKRMWYVSPHSTSLSAVNFDGVTILAQDIIAQGCRCNRPDWSQLLTELMVMAKLRV